MATLATIRSRVRARLGENTAAAWTDPELNQWINEGVRDIARKSETLQVSATIAVTAGTQEYNLPTDMVRVHQVDYQPTGDQSNYTLDYQDFNTMDSVWWTSKNTSQGTPMMWTMWGYPPAVKLILWPKPSRAGTLTVWYYQVPVEITSDAAELPVPNGWEDLVAEYATYMALRRDRDDRWQEAYTVYQKNLDEMLALTRRWTDQAGVIAPRGRMLPSWLVEGY